MSLEDVLDHLEVEIDHMVKGRRKWLVYKGYLRRESVDQIRHLVAVEVKKIPLLGTTEALKIVLSDGEWVGDYKVTELMEAQRANIILALLGKEGRQ